MLTFGTGDHDKVVDWIRAQDAGAAAPVRTAQSHGSRRPPMPVPGDAAGFDLCPDPLSAATAAEFMDTIRLFRVWAGDPTYRQMALACGGEVASSTMWKALNGNRLPALRIVLAIISACGGSDLHAQAFTTAWRSIRMAPMRARPPGTSPRRTGGTAGRGAAPPEPMMIRYRITPAGAASAPGWPTCADNGR